MTKETIDKIDKIISEAVEHWNTIVDKRKEMNANAGWNIANMELGATVQCLNMDIYAVIMEEYSPQFKTVPAED